MSDSDDTDILLLIPPNLFLSALPENHLNEEFIGYSMSCPKWDTDRPSAINEHYEFLAPNQQMELENINVRLANLEPNFCPPSDISTISNCTVGERKRKTGARVVTHSTPKGSKSSDHKYQGVLQEIDHFLQDHKYQQRQWNENQMAEATEEEPTSLPTVLNRVDEEVKKSSATGYDGNLVSLSEMWGKNAPGNLCLKEERFRRVHLEKTIRSLQAKLLEYQQRISVAIEVDKAKDNALGNAQTETENLKQEVLKLKNDHAETENNYQDLLGKYEVSQKELAQTLGLAARFQDKLEKLETDFKELSKKSSETTSSYQMQIQELEAKLHASKKAEEYSANELVKLKDRLAKAEYNCEKITAKNDDLEKKTEVLKYHKEQAQELLQKQRNRADALEEQKNTLNEKLSSSSEKELQLQKKLEAQRQTLKVHYQQQLENVVAQKLKEFQEQMDRMEETLKQEARDRERLIAERAIKQMELINEKNDQEINLLQEKHNEEVELYRIQLASASKKINDLQVKLTIYKTKRADIAEKLHGVMEAQWQKALQILTSPTAEMSHISGSLDNVQSAPENEQFETPKTSRPRDAGCASNVDKLQAYIELLLSKSPQDIANLTEMFTKSKGKVLNSCNKSKLHLRAGSAKPPWKA